MLEQNFNPFIEEEILTKSANNFPNIFVSKDSPRFDHLSLRTTED